MIEKQDALVLLGPTGSGKTPLGELLAARGIHGKRCVHFDFGENLRRIVVASQPDEIVSGADIAFLRNVLETGALLENEDFPVAHRILRSFLRQSDADCETIVVMNGLPRHVGQAESLASVLAMRTVVLLECSPVVVLARIAHDAGGDRAHRTDDALPAIKRKLAIFADRTAPLVDHFRKKRASIIELNVTESMTAEAMWSAL